MSKELWPLDKYPALNPADFQAAGSFAPLRMSNEQLRSTAKSDSEVQVSWIDATARDGAKVPLLLYTSKDDISSKSLKPLVFVIHGGGWVLGDYTVEDAFCRRIVKDKRYFAVSVHYRLSPEVQFPMPLNDCVDSLRYVLGPSQIPGLDKSRIVLAGSSAGANLACGTYQVIMDELKGSIRGLMLNIPVTCDVLHFPKDYANHSWTEQANAPLLNVNALSFLFDQYFPPRTLEPLVSPLLSTRLASFPPTSVICAELDPLRDQGIALHKALESRGVPTRFTLYENVPHGFHFVVPDLPVSKLAVEEMSRSVQWMLEL